MTIIPNLSIIEKGILYIEIDLDTIKGGNSIKSLSCIDSASLYCTVSNALVGYTLKPNTDNSHWYSAESTISNLSTAMDYTLSLHVGSKELKFNLGDAVWIHQ